MGSRSAEPGPRAARWAPRPRPALRGRHLPDALPHPALPDGSGCPDGLDARSSRGLGPWHDEPPGAAATTGEGRSRRPVGRAVGRPRSPASGCEPQVGSAAVGSRGVRPARPLGSGAPPLPCYLPNPHGLGPKRARTPKPQRAHALPRRRALLTARSRRGVPSGPAHAH